MLLEDLVLLPEVHARRALRGRSIRLRILAPLGPFAGRGALRVLRGLPFAGPAAGAGKDGIELVCGYESYEPL